MSWWSKPRIVFVPFLLPTWALAQVWGPFIFVRFKLREYPRAAVLNLLMHELAHVRQWDKYRFTFPFRYLWAWIRAGFSYTENQFEREARHMVDIESHFWLAARLWEAHFSGE